MRVPVALVLTAAIGSLVLQASVQVRSQQLSQAGQPANRDVGPAARPGAGRVPRQVLMDVIATDSRGRFLENLKAADFELREDGIAQTIDEVRLVKTDASAGVSDSGSETQIDERVEAARSDTRLFAIYLDEYHVSAGNSQRVRDVLTRFLDEALRPQDLIVVRRPLESLFVIRMTRDRAHLRQVIAQFEGRKGDYEARNDYERDYIAGTPARIEQLRDQVTTSALNALTIHLGSLNQATRKTLIVVSEGLPRVDRRRGLESLPTVDSVARAANRSNVSIYTVDPSEPGEVMDPAANVLSALVAATDGRSIVRAADLSGAMRQIVADAGAYYLLSYHSARKQDGGFHEVQVTVKRSNVNVRTRKGYWSAPPDEGLRASLSRPVPNVTGPPRRISPLIRPWFGSSRGADGKTRVTFVWEPATRVPGDRAVRASASRIVLKALAADGTPLFEGAVLPTGTPALDRANAAEARAVFDAPPGRLQLQMSIEDRTAQPIDTDVREIVIRDLTRSVVLGTPQVLRARTARDFRALEEDPQAAPVVSRDFSRTERLMIRVTAYGPDSRQPSISARLLNRGGLAMRQLTVQQGDSASALGTIDLPLASLATGDYVVELTAKSPAGEAKDLVQFRVTP
jgi:VWFA-related protein